MKINNRELNNFSLIDISFIQKNKLDNKTCGDSLVFRKTMNNTIVILADGLGSGVKASIYAKMITTQILEMIELGFSIRESVKKIIKQLHKARTENIPFAAFTIVQVIKNKYVFTISYEAPPPIIVEENISYIPKLRFFTLYGELLAEANFNLSISSKIILVSDGVTQAGLGQGLKKGWEITGVRDYINKKLYDIKDKKMIPDLIIEKAKQLSNNSFPDDTSVVIISKKIGKKINILTGPPVDKDKDQEFVKKFLETSGLKIICGSTTIEIFSRITGRKVIMNKITEAYSKPPSYYIEGIDIATEGAVVLNQVSNIINIEIDEYDPDSVVSKLAALLKAVDVVHFWFGKSENPGHQGILFTQMGLFPRIKIVPELVKQLQGLGKVVVVNEY